MASAERVYLVDGARTPIGSFNGAFKDVPAHELGATAARGAFERSGVMAGEVEEVVMGCIGQVGPDAFNARRVALAAGVPEHVPAFTVNRLCGSGLQAIWSAALQLQGTDAGLALAGGDESMSRMPFYDFGPRGYAGLGNRTLVDGTVMMLTDPFHDVHMGITAENVAERYGITRDMQDEFALASQRKAASPEARAAFAEEIVPVEIGGRKPRTVDTDEHPRPDTTAEILAGLRAAFRKDGTVTAGNASGINDGAGAVVLATEAEVQRRGLNPLVTLEAVTTAGIDPLFMGYAPVLALKSLFEKTGVSADEIDVFEVNEAFAAQAVAVVRDAGIDPEKVNPYGGGIALGHPVGATGAILSVRVAKDLKRRGLRYGVVTMCIGGGQALAALYKRADA